MNSLYVRIPSLIDENPILVYPFLAKVLGINEAIVLQQFWFYINQKRKQRKYKSHEIDGKWWIYNTYKEWVKQDFVWLTPRGLQNIILKLEKQGILLSRQGVENPYDREKWYAIDLDKLTAVLEEAVLGHDTFYAPSEEHSMHDDIMHEMHDVYTEREITTESLRSSAISDDTDLGLPSPADAGDVDPQPPAQKTVFRPTPLLADNATLNRLRGKKQPESNQEEAQNEAQDQRDQKPVKTSLKPSIPPLAPVPNLAEIGRRKQQEQHDSQPKIRAIHQFLADRFKKPLNDSEKKSLEQRRELEWRGKPVNGMAAADLWDRDPHFQTYVRWMLEQAANADITASKTLVGMIRNYNRGDASAPGKIAGWWLWEETNARPASQQTESLDPATYDWNNPDMFDSSKTPPFREIYVWNWGHVKNKDGDLVVRWYRKGKVADLPDDVREEYLRNLNS